MDCIDELLQNYETRLFCKYVIFAGLATLVDLGLLYSMTEFLNIWYIYSAAIAYSAGMVSNYTLNKYLNFKNKSRQIVRQFSLFIMVALIGLGLNQLILYCLVEFIKLWYMFAKLISISIVMLWSFYGHKNLTFNILK